MDRSETAPNPSPSLPPILLAEHESAPLDRGPWYRTIGPAYLGVFVWAPFFDSLWTMDLARFPLPSLIASAVLASLLCFGLLYYIPASWGFQTGRPLGIVAASTFGTVGSEWITGIMVAAASIVWYAVAIDYAVESTLLGLQACDLIAVDLHPSRWGPVSVKSPYYLCTALFWIYITGTAGLWKLPGVVVALMRVYAPVALLLLTGVALWILRNVDSYGPGNAAWIGSPGLEDPWRGHNRAVHLITGFFAMAGLISVDWGARARRRRDVVMGGLTGIVLAGSCTAIMSLVVVAGTVADVRREDGLIRGGAYGPVSREGGRYYLDSPAQELAFATTGRGVEWLAMSIADPLRLTFRWAVYYGIGGVAAGAILILFGLAALAPACYSAGVYGQKLSTHWPFLGQTGWTWFGGAIALGLGATSNASRLQWIFSAIGDLFAPAVGAMVGDCLCQNGGWAGVRPGVNRAGLLAWGTGFATALVLEVDELYHPDSAAWYWSGPICGFVAALVYYGLLARLGRSHAAVPLSQHETGP